MQKIDPIIQPDARTDRSDLVRASVNGRKRAAGIHSDLTRLDRTLRSQGSKRLF